VSNAIFIALRRMRAPLIVLISIYAISVLGLALIPGADAQGRPVPLSFFHAFYFMSYTATTIGFGEIPHAFTDAQRLWVTFCIYLSVIGWAYAIGALLALLQDRGFQHALSQQRVWRKVRRFGEPFYLICGYGETGQLLARSLDHMRRRFAVVDVDPRRIDELDLQDYRADAPGLVADARETEALRVAGLALPNCQGVFALTNDDTANLAVAVSARLLHPGMAVLCRVSTPETAVNMAAFGTEHIINPFDKFGDYLALAMRSPGAYQLLEWLTGVPGTALQPQREPPRGHWIVCGYGRFGRALVEDLVAEELDLVIVEPDGKVHCPVPRVTGRGTEVPVLREAGIERASGIVACTDSDIANLAIIALARQMNPEVFVVLRQNQTAHQRLFDAMQADFVMLPAQIIAHEALAVLTTPLLARFLWVVKRQSDDWACEVVSRLAQAFGQRVPMTWRVHLSVSRSPALIAVIEQGRAVRIEEILRDTADRSRPLPCVPLLLVRDGVDLPMPADDEVLRVGDELLLAGRSEARQQLARILENGNDRDYVLDGRDPRGGWLWQRLRQRATAA
jgi:Trk K+ transport system NAD-binding subunit